MTPSRSTVPSAASLGLTGRHAATDLEWLGWTGEDSVDLLWTLAGAGDQNLALNTLRRLGEALGDSYGEFDRMMRENEAFRVRTLALLGGSSALGDHLVANPELWRTLADDVPEAEEMRAAMLNAAQDRYTLRDAYRSLILRIAAHDLAGTYASRRGRGEGQPELGYERTTSLLTELADAGLNAALAVANREVYGEDEPDARLAVIAMGKCGAGELNYISDVDVIFVAEPATPKATRVASEFMRLGSAAFFEVDANLRPEGKSGALVRTLESHVAYYKRWASTWEFQALLKARPMVGDRELGEEYVRSLNPMVWEASRRESFVEDVQAMRRRVIDNVPDELKERELKLGRGGLRDVEFAVQLLQMVHGRSDDTLRPLATTDALKALVDGGYVGREDGQAMIEAYEFLRLLEHRLQLQRMRRTHALPEPDDAASWEWLAAGAGYRADPEHSAVENVRRRLKDVRLKISGLHEKLFYRPLLNSVVTMSIDELRLSPEAARDQLAALGYRYPGRAFEHLSALASGGTRKDKLQAILLPTLMAALADTADPDAGLLNYRKLSEAAHDNAWFLRTLRDEGIVAQRLMKILGTSPYTADLVISTPDVVKLLSDGTSGPKLLDTPSGQVSTSLVAASKRHKDPDKAVARARALRRFDLARIACADLLGFMDVPRVCEELSNIWIAVLQASLLAEIRASQMKNEWEEAPARIAVIGMGRLGGSELGYGSDADVLVVAEPLDGVDASEAIAWAASIIDGLRGRLKKPSADPALEVDLGLRPEGRSGPVVRTIASFERYYREWGETWEVQALLRASFAAGDAEVGERFLRMIDQFRYPEAGATRAQIREIRRIKARVDDERLPRGADRTTHTKLGRGALTDIEWTVQLLTMEHAHEIPGLHNTSTLEILDVLEEIDDPAIITAAQVTTLRDAWIMATRARNAIVLVKGKRKDQLPAAGPDLMKVSGAAGWGATNYQDFLETYLRLTRRARNVVDEIFWGEAASHEHA